MVNRVYATMEEVEADYLSGALHPGDLKNSLKAEINAYAVTLPPPPPPIPSEQQPQSIALCSQSRTPTVLQHAGACAPAL